MLPLSLYCLTFKIGDFGMARDLMDDTYYTSQTTSKIPVKWTAPEVSRYKVIILKKQHQIHSKASVNVTTTYQTTSFSSDDHLPDHIFFQALLYKKYSSDSDVWSYAMLLFEVWTVGKKPYPSMSNQNVIRIIKSGHCQPPPSGCPRAIYKLMVDCW